MPTMFKKFGTKQVPAMEPMPKEKRRFKTKLMMKRKPAKMFGDEIVQAADYQKFPKPPKRGPNP